MPNSIMVSIITYQRADSLQRLLHALQKQACPQDSTIEICVIDNACSPHTQQIIDPLQNAPFKIHLINEPRKGIVHARNTAVDFFQKSAFAFMAFIDDDEWPQDQDWLKKLYQAQQLTMADIVTSDVLGHPETKNVQWASDALRSNRIQLNDLSNINVFYTGNILIKRHVFDKITPPFHEKFNTSGSEDLHFAMRCKKEGFKAVYTKHAKVIETFPQSRANLKWFFMRGFRSGCGSTIAALTISLNFKTYLLCTLIGFIRLFRSCWTLFKAALSLNKSYWARGVLQLGSSMGTFAGMFNINYREYKTIHGK